MIKQIIDVEGYWKVVVYWNVDYSLHSIIMQELKSLGLSRGSYNKIIQELDTGKAKAVTCSDGELKKSVVLFSRHEDWTDYLNSLVHEAEHVKQAMLEAYKVKDEGEPPAYTIGYLVGRLWEGFRLCQMSK